MKKDGCFSVSDNTRSKLDNTVEETWIPIRLCFLILYKIKNTKKLEVDIISEKNGTFRVSDNVRHQDWTVQLKKFQITFRHFLMKYNIKSKKGKAV